MLQPKEKQKMSPQDESLWFKVRIALKVDPVTEPVRDMIKISVSRGHVTLDGTVPSAEVIEGAQRVALGVADVIGITNNLVVA